MSVHGIARDTVVDERYKVLNRIGSGGMADVYCAEDLQLGRRVALKLLYRRFAEDEEFVERFRREASSAAGLQHPNVVAVYDRGEFDGTYYIAMEFLEGRSLKQVVRQDGALDPDRAIDLVIQILKAARFAHRRGIVHRDIKPHNVIVDDEGRAKVTDFGIARAGASDMTETGSIMGTAQYLSPEQAQGHPVDARADLYSIGVVLYELLTGRVPFDAESAVTIALKQVSEEPVPPSEFNPAVSDQLEDVVMRALQKDPALPLRRRRGVHRRARGRRAGSRPGPASTRGSRRTPAPTRGCRARSRTSSAPTAATSAGCCGCCSCSRWWGSRIGAYLLLVPEKVGVPEGGRAALGHRGADPPEPRLRGERRERALRQRARRPRGHAAAAAGPGGRRGLDGDDHRLERAGRRDDPVRARLAAGDGRAAAEAGGLQGRRAARVQRRGQGEPGDRDVAVRALAARARQHGDARGLARPAQGRGPGRGRQGPRRGRADARVARAAGLVHRARGRGEGAGHGARDVARGGHRGRAGRDGDADDRQGARAGRGARTSSASRPTTRSDCVEGGRVPRAPARADRRRARGRRRRARDEPAGGREARQGLAGDASSSGASSPRTSIPTRTPRRRRARRREGRRPGRGPLLRAQRVAGLRRDGERRAGGGGARGRCRCGCRATGRWKGPDGAALSLVPGGGLLGAEVAFPVLHGPFGEDGTIQGLLELLDVPYVGAGVLASSLCMDKVVFKEVLAAAGVPQVGYLAVRQTAWQDTPDAVRASLAPLGLPLFVKPARLGSSVGISKVTSAEELDGALETAFQHDGLAIAEAFSPGIEVECSVTGNGEPEASLPAEVVLQGADWYDYEAKYAPGGVELEIPARVDVGGDRGGAGAGARDVPARGLLGAGAGRLLRRGRRPRARQRAQHAAGHDGDERLPEDVGGDRAVVPVGLRPAAGARARALPRGARRATRSRSRSCGTARRRRSRRAPGRAGAS